MMHHFTRYHTQLIVGTFFQFPWTSDEFTLRYIELFTTSSLDFTGYFLYTSSLYSSKEKSIEISLHEISLKMVQRTYGNDKNKKYNSS
jgi:hypothetical protein